MSIRYLFSEVIKVIENGKKQYIFFNEQAKYLQKDIKSNKTLCLIASYFDDYQKSDIMLDQS